MKKKHRKKPGSSLLMLMIFMSVLSILGTALLTLSVSSYKVRNINALSKKSLYSSEAGLDEAYGILGNLVDAAVKHSNEEVKKDMDNLDIEDLRKQQLEHFLQSEKIEDSAGSIIDKVEDLNKSYKENTDINNTVNDKVNALDEIKYSNYPCSFMNIAIENEAVTAKIESTKLEKYQSKVFQRAYRDYVEEIVNKDTGYESAYDITKEENYQFNENGTKPEVEITNNKNVDGSSKILEFSENNGKYELTLKIQSTFTSSSASGKESIRKIVAADYIINVPEYKDIYYVETLKFPKNATWTKAIALDGDMIVNSKAANISGDIFVKGKDNDNGGINLNNEEASLTIEEGNVLTSNNIFLSSPKSKLVNKNGNIYTKNVIIKKDASQSNLDIDGALYTMDDLTLNAEKSQVNIKKGFYGVQDGSKDSGHDKSSSIVINTEDIGSGSQIAIAGDVIIAGTSYIGLNNNEKYQTGESLSVKGNYKAYTKPIQNATYGQDKVEFKYIDPIVLAYKFKNGTEFNVTNKSDYFKLYNEQYTDDDVKLNLGKNNGIHIEGKNIEIDKDGTKVKYKDNLIFSTGTVISNGEILNNNPAMDNEGKWREKEREAKKMMYFMGDDSLVKRKMLEPGSAYSSLDDVLNNTSDLQFGVNFLVDFDAIKDDKLTDITFGGDSNEAELVFLNKNKDKKIIIQNGSENKIVDTGDIVVTIKNGVFKGMIISPNDIELRGDIKFKGTIIGGGDLILSDEEPKSIIYDKDYVKELIAKNYDHLSSVFMNGDSSQQEIWEKIGPPDDTEVDIIRDKLIRRENWKLTR